MDIDLVRRQFPYLREHPDDFLCSQPFRELAKANEALAAAADRAASRALDKKN
jgi:hypothetical protein